MKPFISIILASNKPDRLKSFLKDIVRTTSDLSAVEVLVVLDKGDDQCKNVVEDCRSEYNNLQLKSIEALPKRGYFSLNHEYNKLLGIADPNSKVFTVFSDEIKFKTIGWEQKLKKYTDHFEDGVYAVRISKNKFSHYYRYYDAAVSPDNFSFYSRKLLELCGGYGDFWGPDTSIQVILELCKNIDVKFCEREIISESIELEDYYYEDCSRERSEMIGWSFGMIVGDITCLENSYRIAVKITLYLRNYKLLNLASVCAQYDFNKKIVSFVDKLGSVICKANFVIPFRVFSMVFVSRSLERRIDRYSAIACETDKYFRFLFAKLKLSFLAIKSLQIPLYLKYLRSSKGVDRSAEIEFIQEGNFPIEYNTNIQKMIDSKYYKTFTK